MWDVFDDPSDPPAPNEVAPSAPQPVKVARKDPNVVAKELAAALQPFADDAGNEVIVPPPCHPSDAPRGYASLPAWEPHPPVQWGPIRLEAKAVGGCRGLVASRDVEVGEVLLAEEPLVPWPSADRAPASLLHALLTSSEVSARLEAVAHLHPQTIDDALASVGAMAVERLRAEHEEAVEGLAPLWEATAGSGTACATPVARDAVLRLCLAMQWNAFDSGLFLHEALLNHASAYNANCDKASHQRRGGAGVLSVVRATRRIRAGEECFICYLQPAELSRAAARERLKQFDFSCSCARHPVLDRPPIVGNAMAAGAVGEVGEMAAIAAEPATASAAEQATDARAEGGWHPTDATLLALEDAAERRLKSALREARLTPLVDGVRTAIAPLVDACGARHLAVANA